MTNILTKLQSDPYANLLGVEIDEVTNGYAKCSLVIKESMLNFGGFPHGGMIFSLADVAFSGAACSLHQASTALNINGNFSGTSKVGNRIVAEAKLTNESRKFSYFTIEVKDGEKLIASFNGTAYKIA